MCRSRYEVRRGGRPGSPNRPWTTSEGRCYGPRVQFGISVPCFGIGVDATLLADWAEGAEAAGWDGFFLWDHLFAFAPGKVDVVDPWITLTAAACRTSRVRLGPLVTPLPRRRPMVVARQTSTLDRLSHGRLVLGVGIGAGPFEWDYCGEEPDLRRRGEMLDEHLELLTRLWTGELVSHRGSHYRVSGPEWSAICYPPPVQRPRIPVWVGGTWPRRRPIERAARWDGYFPISSKGPWTLGDTTAAALRLQTLRTSETPIELVVPGASDGTDESRHDSHAAHEAAGATWWIESVEPWRFGWTEGKRWPLEQMRERIDAGP
jgi:alkanesulfonate monooxygenase SsuD/methylene tetrahydromethanopterin reductase-like flavin-dependent oxidoreductase (luciferase family)